MSISQRANGKWTAQIKDPATGKRISLGTFEKRAQAKDALADAEDRLRHNEPVREQPENVKGAIPFNEFVEIFLHSGEIDVAEDTRKQYETACKWMTLYFTKVLRKDTRATNEDAPAQVRDVAPPLNSITAEDIAGFNAWFRYEADPETGEHVIGKDTGDKLLRSANYRRKTAQRVRQLFTVAVKHDYIAASAHPYTRERSKLPPPPKEVLRAVLEHKAADKILETLDVLRQKQETETERMEAEYWANLLGCALVSGLRMSEICGLQIKHLKPATKSIEVEQQWAWNAHGTTRDTLFRPPKSKRSNRNVPLTEANFDTLWRWATYIRQVPSPHDLLFPRPNALRRDASDGSGWGLWGSRSHFTKRYNDMMHVVWDHYLASQKDTPWETMPFSEEQIRVNFHEWRHCFAVACLREGLVDADSVSAWLGHFSAAFTYQVYSRYVGDEEGNRQKLELAFRRQPPDLF